MRRVACLLAVLGGVLPAAAIGPPINTDTPITLGFAGRGVRTFAKVTRASVGDREITTTLWPLAIPFNVTTKTVVGIVVPTLFKEIDSGSESVSSSGLGDVSLFAKYVLVQIDRPGETFRLAPKVVLKLPTGDDEASPALGSGSTDVSLGAVGAWLRGRRGIYVEALLQRRGESGGREFGRGLLYNVAFAYRVLPVVYRTYPARQVNAYLELSGSWTARDEVAGVEVAASGGHVLFVAPGLQYIPWSRLLVETSLQLPLVRDLKAGQPKPDWTASLGTRVLLF
jgi:hypothetical protein